MSVMDFVSGVIVWLSVLAAVMFVIALVVSLILTRHPTPEISPEDAWVENSEEWRKITFPVMVETEDDRSWPDIVLQIRHEEATAPNVA